MADKAPTDALGNEIIVDDGTARQDQPAHPKDAGALKDADKVSGPYVADADHNDPPVRTNHPDVPIIQRLGVGAGQHTPPIDEDIGVDGRYRVNNPDGTLNVDLADNTDGVAADATSADAARK